MGGTYAVVSEVEIAADRARTYLLLTFERRVLVQRLIVADREVRQRTIGNLWGNTRRSDRSGNQRVSERGTCTRMGRWRV